jgi:hypothetical protein
VGADKLPDDVSRWYGVAFLGERDADIEAEQTKMLINILRHDPSNKAFVDGLRVSMLTKNKFPVK